MTFIYYETTTTKKNALEDASFKQQMNKLEF